MNPAAISSRQIAKEDRNIYHIFLSEQAPTRWEPQSGQGFQCRWTGGQLAREISWWSSTPQMLFWFGKIIGNSKHLQKIPWYILGSKLPAPPENSLHEKGHPPWITGKKHGKGCGQPSFVVLVGTCFSQNWVWKQMEGLPCKQGFARFCFVYHCKLKTLRILQGIHPWIDAGRTDGE